MPKDDKNIIMVGSGYHRRVVLEKLMNGIIDPLEKNPLIEKIIIFKTGNIGMTESLITGYHYFDVEKFKRTFSSKPYVDKSVREFCSGPLGVPYVGK